MSQFILSPIVVKLHGKKRSRNKDLRSHLGIELGNSCTKGCKLINYANPNWVIEQTLPLLFHHHHHPHQKWSSISSSLAAAAGVSSYTLLHLTRLNYNYHQADDRNPTKYLPLLNPSQSCLWSFFCMEFITWDLCFKLSAWSNKTNERKDIMHLSM